eukprot:Colp12_sorted_trinity150504_noHs@36296
MYMVQDDAYVRVLPLLNYLSRVGGTKGHPKKLFIGMPVSTDLPVVDSYAKQLVVVPKTQLTHLDAKRLPPLVHPFGVGLSRDVAEMLVANQDTYPGYVHIGAGLGMVLAGSQMDVKYAVDVRHEDCDQDTFLHTPLVKPDLNMQERHEADLGAYFCPKRSNLMAPLPK